MKNRLIVILFGFILIVAIFKSWFINSQIIGGDWPYFFKETLQGFSPVPFSWRPISGNGLGGQILFFSLDSYLYFIVTVFVNSLRIPWEIIYKVFFFGFFLVLSLFSSSYLLKACFTKIRDWQVLVGSVIYVANTYILMLVGGGQMGIAMSYSILPLVLYSFIKLNENIKLKYSVLFGILFGILVMFDLRIAYIMLLALGIYFLFNIKQLIFGKDLKEIVVNISYIFIIPFAVSGLLHAFWILPLLVFHQNPAQSFGAVFTSTDAVKFFSFAKFEDAISLLHPNWPENIFGKVGFMKPEFLLLPILAYSSLFFISKTKDQGTKNYILFFAILGLLGAFLAKGANEPFGGVYLWLFDNFPGFIMFRDPTKWYTLVAISYSILIPFTVWKIYEWLKTYSKFSIFNFQFSIKSKIFNSQNLFLLLLISYLLFLIRPGLLGQLSGTFKATTIPNEYIRLEQFLSSQNSFSRTLWVPTLQRFGYYSNLHPAIPAQNLFKTVENTEIIKKMNTQETELFLQEAGVKYVIVPYDSQGEIYLKDRKYNNEIYQKTINEVNKIPYLKQVNGFGKIAVFEVHPPAGGPKDHFYIKDLRPKIDDQSIKYKYISPVEYKLEVKNAKIGDKIIFSENYDASWMARDRNTKFYDWLNLIGSNPYNRLFNSFTLRKSGDYSLIVYYYPQILVNIGIIVSGLTLVLILSVLIYLKKKKI